MKVGDRVRILNLDYWKTNYGDTIKRNKKLIGMDGKIIDINLGIFKVQFEDESTEYFDGRELEIFDIYKSTKVDLVFVSWQQKGKSVYRSDEFEWLFTGDMHRGVVFGATMELGEEEVERIKKAEGMGIKPVFDLVINSDESRKKAKKEKED
ncbi:MAG: hypothetical protein LLG37_07000 [Spirochaetia bacterium]|nr:hypothetical protein [Spirochaetia bacterium]